MTSICLALNVRDAEQHIARCITSALPLVDRAVIIDTGSLDNTVAVAREALGDLPTEFYESEWVGHAHNRTELLQKAAASGAEWVLQLDADMELVQEAPLRELVKDEYMIPIRDRGLVYPLPLLTSTKKRFFYAGVAHAYLACHDGPTDGEVLTELALIDHGGGGHREGKIERDAELLAAEVGKNPADARSWFYLAQSYRDLGQVEKAIAAYKIRAGLGGWGEEVYQALYQAGMLLCEHVNYYDGAKLLIAAAEMKQNRAEALRALAGCSSSVADKIPFPLEEVLFVEPGAYREQPKPINPPVGISPDKVSAVIVTRGNVDLAPTLAPLPFDDIVIWDNSERENLKTYGRVKALEECRNDVVFTVDDDVIFAEVDRLLAAYEPGVIVCNMDDAWVQGAGYGNFVGQTGAGSVYDRNLPIEACDRYLAAYPYDDEFLTWCDAIVGVLAPFKRVDLGYEVRDFSDDPGRLWTTPGNTQRKWAAINRSLALMEQAA